MIKLSGAHDAAMEKLKAALVIPVFVFLPKVLHDRVLTAPVEAKEALALLVEKVCKGKAEELISDDTLRIAGSRTADQSPYGMTLVSSAKGHNLCDQPAGRVLH